MTAFSGHTINHPRSDWPLTRWRSLARIGDGVFQ